MLVKAIPTPTTTLGFVDKETLVARPFNLPRAKAKASAFLRHGNLIPTRQQQLNTIFKLHNSRQPVCNLPEQVLRKIFFQCVRLSIASNDSGNESWSWTNVSYVCSSWRKAALACSDLWRCIDFSHPRSCAITLERAKMFPLHIDATVTDENTRLIQRTLQLAHRIQNIYLRASLQQIYPFLQLLVHPNPALESLVVDVHIPKSRPFGEVYEKPSFPTTCGPVLQNLKYMELRSTPFYLLTSRCTHLTQFHVHDLPLTGRPTFHKFLTMLEQMQNLEHLTLNRSFPINMDLVNIKALERRITLPKLESISLVGSIPETTNILECIAIPPSTQLNVKICTLSDLKNNIWRLSLWLISRSCVEGDGNPLETLTLTGNETRSRFLGNSLDPDPEFRLSLRIKAFRSDCEDGRAAFDITFDPHERIPDDELMVTALTTILKALSLTHIQTLAVQDINFLTQKSWSQLLCLLPFLRILDITGRAPSGLAWALLSNARSHEPTLQIPEDESWDQRLFVPRLNDIYLHRVDCSSGGYMVSHTTSFINSYRDLDDSRFLDVLNAGLCERRQLGLCLRSLSIDKCEFVLKKSIGDARMVVANVVVCDIIRKLMEDEDVDPTFPARYRGQWNFEHPQIEHYYRLEALAMDIYT